VNIIINISSIEIGVGVQYSSNFISNLFL